MSISPVRGSASAGRPPRRPSGRETQGRPMTTSPAPAALRPGHIGLNVTDLDRSLPFYGRVLGLETLAEGKADSRRWAFLGRDGEPVVTLWTQSTRGFATGTAGLHHLSFQVDSLDD